MNQEKLTQFVERAWDDEIVPQLVEYIRIPNKSPMFDADWVKHGYMDAGGQPAPRLGAGSKIAGMQGDARGACAWQAARR